MAVRGDGPAEELIVLAETRERDSVRREEYRLDKGQTATNLIVERRGKTRPDEIVLLGAPYDTVPETPGADDNASAVAVLLETARLLAGRTGRVRETSDTGERRA